MSGRSSQTKGRRAEIELCGILQEAGYNARVGMPESYGKEPDIVCDDFPLHVEVKRCERLCVPEWITQSERDAAKFRDGAPSVIFRQNRQPWRVIICLSDFLRLCAKQTLDDGSSGW